MRLLVSVGTAAEAAAAVDGGADLVDAKDPAAGPLGAVSIETLSEIHAVVGGRRPVTAALGDAADETEIEGLARAYADAGASLVKIGFAGIADTARADVLTKAAVRGAESAGRGCGVVAVAYADHSRAASLPATLVVEVAARAGARGFLLDTADKNGPGLRDTIALEPLSGVVSAAHEACLLVALAGKLSAEDFAFARHSGTDVIGVRTAACEGGRGGRVTRDRVGLLKLLCRSREPAGRRSSSGLALASAFARGAER